MLLCSELTPESTNQTHIYDWLDNPDNRNHPAWRYLDEFTKCDLEEKAQLWLESTVVLCSYQGTRYRLTGASRLGDVWIHSNFNVHDGYVKRVDITELSDWEVHERKEAVA